jgi:hypothetical protein
MSAGSLTADFTVPLFGTLMCITPAITRPTVQFGVRIPSERAGAAVIRRERRAYYWRTAAIGACCIVNFASPAAWLIIAGIVAAPAGLAAIGAAAGW